MRIKLISDYAVDLIGRSVPNLRFENSLIEEICTKFIAFLDPRFRIDVREPGIPDTWWSAQIMWEGPLNYLIEIVTIATKAQNFRKLTLERNYRDEKQYARTFEFNKKNNTVSNVSKGSARVFEQEIYYRSTYLMDHDNPDRFSPLWLAEESYKGQIKCHDIWGA